LPDGSYDDAVIFGGASWRRPATLFAVALVLVLAWTRWSSDDTTPERVVAETNRAATVAPTGLDGTSWVLESGAPIVKGYEIRLFFEGEIVGGFDGCNGFGGIYSTNGQAVTIGSLAGTEEACGDEVMVAAGSFSESLQASTSYALEDGQLLLSGSGIELVLSPTPPIDLDTVINATWVLESLLNGNVSIEVDGTEAFLRLEEDASILGSTGCRVLSGDWFLAVDSTFNFPNFEAEGTCSSELASQDRHVVGVLGDGFTARLEGGLLIVTATGNRGLTYRRIP